MNRRTTLNRMVTMLGIATLASLQGCAAPMGAAFTTPAAIEQDKANLYLYRQNKLNARSMGFTVQLNNLPPEELLNASHILMKISKGDHILTVKPGPFGKTYEHRWFAEAGKNYYLEFELPPLLLANAFNLGSDIVVRDEVTAQQDMKTLKGMK